MERELIICAVVLILCILSSKTSGKIGIPALLIFIFIGMMFGSDGIMKIPFDNYLLAENVCTIALVIIMFYGGFSTKWTAAKPVAVRACIISSAGVVITALLTGLFSFFVLRIDLKESILLGAVISSTDAASVFSILRSKNLNLKGGLAPLLEVESGSNDPFSYMLTFAALVILKGQEVGFVAGMIVLQLIFGVLFGVLFGYFSPIIMKKLNLLSGSFDSIFLSAIVLLSYAIPSVLGGNGYLSVYIAGIIMGNSKIKNTPSLVHFFNGITGMAQIIVFSILGLLSFPSRLPSILVTALLVFLFLTFVARPVAVFILMIKGYDIKEKMFVSWAGLRGASSIVFAIMATVSDAPVEIDIFHIIFCVSLLSVSVQGTLLPFVAKKLNLIDNNYNVLKTFNDYAEEKDVAIMKVHIAEGHGWENKKISEVNMPDDSLALMIKRGDGTIIPKGNTIIMAGDDVILNVPIYSVENDITLKEITVHKGHEWENKKIGELKLSDNTLITLIKRKNEAIIPDGNTVIKKDDIMVIYQ